MMMMKLLMKKRERGLRPGGRGGFLLGRTSYGDDHRAGGQPAPPADTRDCGAWASNLLRALTLPGGCDPFSRTPRLFPAQSIGGAHKTGVSASRAGAHR